MYALTSMARALTPLKELSKCTLLAEMLDLATTLYGIGLIPELTELNPLVKTLGGWGPTVLAKGMVAILLVAMLEKVDNWPPIVWVVPIIAGLPAVLNLLSILMEIVV